MIKISAVRDAGVQAVAHQIVHFVDIDGARYDAFPKKVSTEIRVSLERMVIRSYASLLKNKSNVESFKISSYRLANDKIDK